MAWSVSDLSIITNELITVLKGAVSSSTLLTGVQTGVTGASPDETRQSNDPNQPDVTLNIYLLHVARDMSWRNTPVSTSGAQLAQSQPLSLDLSYLLTSYAKGTNGWIQEQQIMSVALSYFHANPIYKTTTGTAEFTVTVEADSIEEMSRLWQAITVPIRMSALFRVAVVFLAPPKPPATDSRAPVEVNVSVGPDLGVAAALPPPAVEPVLLEVARQVAVSAPPPAWVSLQQGATQKDVFSSVVSTAGDAVAFAGSTVRVRATGLNSADAAAVYLSPAAGGFEWPITAWKQPSDMLKGFAADADELVLKLPPAYGAAPAMGVALAATPPPGRYLLTVGNPGTGYRSKALTAAIGPLVTGTAAANSLLKPDAAGTYTLNALGLVANQTTLLLNTTALTMVGPLGPGIAVVDTVAGTIAWQLAAAPGFASGTYVQVGVVVNGIAAPPGWWIQIP
jgi:hypothetical protein